ncbi:SpvB/TcaC N-terminal domain-containing protein [Pseudomonas sp. Q1]|uniref:SpvB/TcaC N-terminal domain-containing protein n=1 Tax=Pseudomonas sp. Q1 TaxID=2202823 RepID=UPI001374AECC|nr:SpvB/TcaC N-terminal domain-containing protein [Pseudomonas sp. Q1]NCE88413.1 hypothetical protein [Pseudomonas sp. Q1]
MTNNFAAPTGNESQPFFTLPSLPKGGGTLAGNTGVLSVGGPDGNAGWQIPLPISAAPARGLAPQLALNYSNSGGNGVFGMGWQMSSPMVRVRTQHGVPTYDSEDRFNGPNNGELVRAPGSGAVRTETRLPFSNADSGTYTVTRYLDRSAGLGARTERWDETGAEGAVLRTFWIDFTPDGGLALYGWSEDARLADPQDSSRVAEWRIEEAVSARGEHILWRWRQEDDIGCPAHELVSHPQVAGLYPDAVYWMNRTPALQFMLPDMILTTDAWQNEWLAFLAFDYGERGTLIDQAPPLTATAPWPVRGDRLSFRRYGFEVRTRRLCHDILLWHRTAMMANAESRDAVPQLISRLNLQYETSELLTRLMSAQILAYEQDGTAMATPPVEFALSEPPPTLPGATAWQPMPALDGFSHEFWQMADLYGEGIPGVLYQDRGAWWYRAPIREGDVQPLNAGFAGLFHAPLNDRVTWGAPTPLPRLPLGGNARLADLNGDGQPELVIALPGLSGSFTLQPNGHWGGLKLFDKFPVEFAHPAALQTDLTGGGLTDLVLIGPSSVRLWPSAGLSGWKPAKTVQHQEEGSLPHPSGDGTRLVAFSDVTGGGLTDLVEITASGVTTWPSLGHGRFGSPVHLSGFSLEALKQADNSPLAFNPERIYLADTDGTGIADILVIGQRGIHVFINHSGNGFRYKGVVPPPNGVRLDDTSRLQVADVQGLGMGSLMLTVPHLLPRSWVLNFSSVRPWLLSTVVDNIGGRTQLTYRSSAQGWLDEKASRQAAGQTAVSYLPFPVHTVRSVSQINEITGLTLGSETLYLGGVWDGEERELAGFRCLVQTDRSSRSQENARQRSAVLSPPARTVTWFYTGNEELDSTGADGARTDIDHAFINEPVRFTVWTNDGDVSETPEPGSARRRALYRALRGQMMRTEVYAEDGHPNVGIPYSISRQRFHVRAYDSANPDGTPNINRPVTLVSPLETLSLACERIAADPTVSQTIVLQQDAYGTPLESVSINYPRQLTLAQVQAEEAERRIYPASLPVGVISETADSQQYDCWIKLGRNRVHHLNTGNDFVIGLPLDTRSDVIWWSCSHPDGNLDRRANRVIPSGGFTAENLVLADLLAEPNSVVFSGYAKTKWRGAAGTEPLEAPTRQGLVAWTDSAMLDEQSLDVLAPVFNQTVGELVQASLHELSGTTNPEVLNRLRERVQPHITPDVFFRAFMAFTWRLENNLKEEYEEKNGCMYRAAIEALQTARRDKKRGYETITSNALWEALGQGGTSGGIPGERIREAVQAYADQCLESDQALNALQEVLVLRTTLDTLYWQVLLSEIVDNPEYHSSLKTIESYLRQPVQQESLEQLLLRGGYKTLQIPHEPALGAVWGGSHNITEYHDQSAFWLAKEVRESELVRNTALTYSPNSLAVVGATDSISFASTVTAIDWRFLTPIQVKDTNDNISEATLDALGRVRHTRFYGTETPAEADQAVVTGYSPTSEKRFTPPATVEDALALNASKGVPVHEAFTMITDSWMPLSVDAEGKPTGRRCGVLARERQEAQLQRDGLSSPSILEGRIPPHVIRIQTDRYDDDPEQQVRLQVVLHGGGQVLQTAIINPSGEAFVRTDAGALEIDDDGKAVVRWSDVRWAVTGQTEFDNKGNPVRVWLPYYLNDWRHVIDDNAREGIYADTHLYDALSREYRILTAAGYERRVQVFPWFMVSEDENDTWQEVLARRNSDGQEEEQ